MTEAAFIAWGQDIEWTLRKTKWGWALVLALLALVLTGGGG